MQQKAQAYDKLVTDANQKQLAQQAFNAGQQRGSAWGREQGLAEMANHVAKQQISIPDQIQMMIQTGEISPEEGRNMLMEHDRYNQANPIGR